MRSLISFVGICFIIFGIGVLGYQGFTYTKREKVLQVGDVSVTADTQKTIYFPPIVGGASLVAGIILVALTRSK